MRANRHILAAVSVVLLSLCSLKVPPPDADEAGFAAYATHGTPFLWETVLPAEHRNLADIYRMVLFPVHVSILRVMLNQFGPGIAQIRAGPCLAAIIGMILLLWLVSSLRLPVWSYWAVLTFGVSHPFLLSAHNARPEPFIFLTMVINLAWLFMEWGRFPALLAGMAAGGAVAIHQSIIFVWVVVPLAAYCQEGRSIFRQPRYAWWLIGILFGFLMALKTFDVEQVMKSLSIAQSIGNVRAPTLLFFHGNLWRILWHTVYIVGTRYASQNAFYIPFMGCVFGTFPWAIRRWDTFTPAEKGMETVAAGMTLAYAFLSASLTANYMIFLLPWYWIHLSLMIHHLGVGGWTLDGTDLALLAWIHLALYMSADLMVIISPFEIPQFLLCSCFFAVLWIRAHPWISPRMALILWATLFAMCLTFPVILRLNALWFQWMWTFHRAMLGGFAAIAVLIGTVIVMDRKGISIGISGDPFNFQI